MGNWEESIITGPQTWINAIVLKDGACIPLVALGYFLPTPYSLLPTAAPTGLGQFKNPNKICGR